MDFEEIQMNKRRKLDPNEINSLPNEIWLKILNCLDTQTIFANFALVCKKFHNLTLDSRAVKTINLIGIDTYEKYKSAKKVLKRSKNLYKIKIRNSLFYCDSFITQAFKSNPKLRNCHIGTQINRQNWIEFSDTVVQAFGNSLETMVLGSVQIRR